MPKKPSPAATKEDIHILMEQLAKLYELNTTWKDEVLDRIEASEQRVIQEFHVVAEHLKHGFQGAFKHKLQQHEDRLVRLEYHLQLR